MTPTTPTDERVLERFLEARAKKQAERAEKGESYRQYLKWSGRALEIPVSVVVGLLLGRFLGGLVDHKDIGTALGLFFGVVTAVRAMVRLARAYSREEGGGDTAHDTDNLDDARRAGQRDAERSGDDGE
jgi:F0F1-type ATP synthase assembly protein I